MGSILRNVENIRKNRILLRYFRTYLLIFLIPLLLFSLYFTRVTAIVQSDDIDKKLNELRRSAAAVDTLLEEVERIGKTIAYNVQVTQFANNTNVFSYANTYNVIQLQESLMDLSFVNELVYDYFLFYDKSEVVINKKIAYTYEDFYRLYFHDSAFASYEDWYADAKNRGRRNGLTEMRDYVFHGKSEPVQMLSFELPLLTYSINDKSVLKVFVQKSTIDALMASVSGDAVQSIHNDAGNTIYYQSRMDDFAPRKEDWRLSDGFDAASALPYTTLHHEGNEYILLRHFSDSSRLTYYSLQRVSEINARIIPLMGYLLVFIAAAILLGIVISFYVSKKNAEPINDLFNDVFHGDYRAEDSKNVFAHLKEFYGRLRDANTELHLSLAEQKPLVQNAFFSRLLYGSINTEEQMRSIADIVKYPYAGKAFWALIFKLFQENLPSDDDIHASDVSTLALLDAIKAVMPDRVPLNMGDGTVVVVMSLPQEQKEQYHGQTEELVQAIRQRVSERIQRMLTVYGGTVVSSLSEVRVSFENAAVMQRMRAPAEEQNVIWYQSFKSGSVAYPDSEIVKTLTQYVLAGNVDELRTCLDNLLSRYWVGGNLTTCMQHLFVDDLQINLLRMIDRLTFDEDSYRTLCLQLEKNHNLDLPQRIKLTKAMYLKLCQYMYEQRSEKPALDLDSVATYINLNIGNNGLSLASVADHFHISEAYLSNAFKQSTGITFSAYVEQARMDKAKELLQLSGASVKDISEKVGYTSSNSFCRAFKRVVGMSPVEYRTHEAGK